ncbi:MAG: carboxylesterase/lipase family protein [Lachnospiraceae bacterium]|nr:carboxylesterase/lipase family protein [Lachnospiraceae bacterium]
MSKTLSTPIGEFYAKTDRVSDQNIEAYLGIRYATAHPFGLPEPVDRYMEVPANTGYGLRFPQQDVPPLMNRFLKNPMMRPEILTNADKTAEDAFVLNIWTDGTEEKKPVLLFIHGGGFTYGSGTTPLYNGRYLAAKGVVVVTLNYRLGIAGFLPVVKADGTFSANRGFYDQQCALQWVRKHIALFGGDENNITLMGQSAGGLSAFTQMLSVDSPQYFDKLIVCSAGEPKCLTKERAIEIWEDFKKQNHISSAEQLMEMPGKRLLKYRMPLEITSSPVMDGALLTEDTASIMPEGRFSIKPVLAGSTGDEMKMVDNKSWYKNLGIVMNEADYQKKCETVYGEEGTRLAEVIRPLAKDLPDLQFKMIEIPMFHASVLKTLERFSAGTSAFGYRMNYVPAVWNGLRGAYHCAELPFIFGTIRDMRDTPVTEENLKQAEVLQDDWIHFMKTGTLSGGEAFGLAEKIRIYDGSGYADRPFPQKEEIREVYDSDLFDRLQKDFMRGRDASFIA